jgi:hypothetical protein
MIQDIVSTILPLFIPLFLTIGVLVGVFTLIRAVHDGVQKTADPFGIRAYVNELHGDLDIYDYSITSNISLYDVRYDRTSLVLRYVYGPSGDSTNNGTPFLAREGYFEYLRGIEPCPEERRLLVNGGAIVYDYYSIQGTNVRRIHSRRVTETNFSSLSTNRGDIDPSRFQLVLEKIGNAGRFARLTVIQAHGSVHSGPTDSEKTNRSAE